MTKQVRRPRSETSRVLDLTCSAAGLIALAPLLGLIALLIRMLDGTPVLFRQVRIGKNGRPFRIWKFRTMQNGGSGPSVTASSDPRVSPLGVILRKYKLDELPQLFNVFRGEMSLIGPRPEVPEFVDLTDPMWRKVLTVRPGITDVVSLIYRDEESILDRCESTNLDASSYYRRIVLPAKLELAVRQLTRKRGLLEDLRLILLTLHYSFFSKHLDTRQVQKLFYCEQSRGAREI